MHLAELQSALNAFLEQGVPCPELRQAVGSLRLPPEECLQLYRQLLRSARILALRQLFPATASLAGRGHFERLADRYAAELAAGAASDPFGELLPALLEGYQREQPELAPLPFLAELAQLEWQLHCAWRAPDDPGLDLDDWARLPTAQYPGLRPVASHSLSLQLCTWPVGAIRTSVLQGQPWQPALALRGGWYCIHRHRDRLCVEAISDEQALLLNGILLGHNLYQLSCDIPAVREHLTLMIARGWICRLQRPDGNDDQRAP